MWAVGVVVYELLIGGVPFVGNGDLHTINLIKECNIDYDSMKISACAKNFLSKLLTKNPKLRLTPREALSCPFILKNLPLTIRTSQESHLNSSFSSHESHYEDKEE